MQLRRQVVEQKGESLVDRLGCDEVVIVEDENVGATLVVARQIVDQQGQKRFQRRQLRRLQHVQHVLANAGVNGLQGGDEIRQKANEVIVALVQRDPGHRPPTTSDPFTKQRGLAKAGRGGDEGELAV